HPQAMPAGGVLAPRTPARSQHGKMLSSLRPRSRDELHEMAKRLIGEDRYAFVLLKEAIHEIGESDARAAWDLLRKQMALVPVGSLSVVHSDGTCKNA